MSPQRKRKLDKATLSLTFKFDSDRFLRFRLATDDERDRVGYQEGVYYRPGIGLIRAAGRRWETDKYDDLISAAGEDRVRFEREAAVDDEVERRLFKRVEDLFDVLRTNNPPTAFIEAAFEVPSSVVPQESRALS